MTTFDAFIGVVKTSARHIIAVFGDVVNICSSFRFDPDSLASCFQNAEKINKMRRKKRNETKTQTNECFAELASSFAVLFLFTLEIKRKSCDRSVT